MPTNGYDFLKDASQITGADWAALVERESGHWQVRDRRAPTHLCPAWVFAKRLEIESVFYYWV